nr:immunoglobulin light chain junction region [Macaca mulatta]MPN80362.1 immunoglobulin light chain junction region [Macaca mulatta]MPN81234.1 immunoglobulin light chain junction region [Macaca mulatta]
CEAWDSSLSGPVF